MKKILGLVAIATLALVSCNKEEGVQVDKMPKSVTIELANVLQTKVMDAPEKNTKAKVNDLCVFFVNGEGSLVQGKNSANTATADHYFTKEEWDAVSPDGTTNDDSNVFHYLAADVNEVIVVANLGDLWTDAEDVALKTGQTKPTTKAQLVALVTEIANNQDCDDLPLIGYSDLTENVGQDNTDHPLYRAVVKLDLLVSRIEITGYEYAKENDATERDYAKIEIQQILFDNYLTEAVLEGTASSTATTVGKDVQDEDAFDYLSDNNKENVWYNTKLESTNDLVTLGKDKDAVETDYVVTYADDANRPAYNYFPLALPRLIIKLVGTAADGKKTTHYLKTSNIKVVDGDNDGASISTLSHNYLYKMNFKFNDGHLEDPLKCVEVEVEVNPWIVEAVTPEF